MHSQADYASLHVLSNHPGFMCNSDHGKLHRPMANCSNDDVLGIGFR